MTEELKRLAREKAGEAVESCWKSDPVYGSASEEPIEKALLSFGAAVLEAYHNKLPLSEQMYMESTYEEFKTFLVTEEKTEK